MVDEVPLQRRSIRLGPSIWRRTATSMPQTGDAACWSVICKEERGQPSDVEELACSGLAYLDRISKDEER